MPRHAENARSKGVAEFGPARFYGSRKSHSFVEDPTPTTLRRLGVLAEPQPYQPVPDVRVVELFKEVIPESDTTESVLGNVGSPRIESRNRKRRRLRAQAAGALAVAPELDSPKPDELAQTAAPVLPDSPASTTELRAAESVEGTLPVQPTDASMAS